TAVFLNNKVPTVFDGQYFKKGNIYKAGSFAGQYHQAALYLEDNIRWNNLNARLGVRADYDESNNNLNFAPRSSISYQPFSNKLLKIGRDTSELQSRENLVCRLLLEKKKKLL